MIMINRQALTILCKRIGIKSQAELARRIQASPQGLNKIIKGHHAATLTTIGKICDVLDCQPGAFLEYKRDDDA